MLKKKLFWLLPLFLGAPSNAFGVEILSTKLSTDADGDCYHATQFKRTDDSRKLNIGKYKAIQEKLNNKSCFIAKIQKMDGDGKYYYQYIIPLNTTWEEFRKIFKDNVNRHFTNGFSKINLFMTNCIPLIQQGARIDLGREFITKSVSSDKEKLCKAIKLLVEGVLDYKPNEEFFINLIETLGPEDNVGEEKNAKDNLQNNVRVVDINGDAVIRFEDGISIDSKTGQSVSPGIVPGGVLIPIVTSYTKNQNKNDEEAEKLFKQVQNNLLGPKN